MTTPTERANAAFPGDPLRSISILTARQLAAVAIGEAVREAKAPRLFVGGEFTAHSGGTLPFKIDCDALSDADIATLAAEIARRFKFSMVIGVPCGGLRLQEALKPYQSWRHGLLIVDDVLTTGRSMERERQRFRGDKIQGVVIFARGPCPDWITPLFTSQPDAAEALTRLQQERDAAKARNNATAVSLHHAMEVGKRLEGEVGRLQAELTAAITDLRTERHLFHLQSEASAQPRLVEDDASKYMDHLAARQNSEETPEANTGRPPYPDPGPALKRAHIRSSRLVDTGDVRPSADDVESEDEGPTPTLIAGAELLRSLVKKPRADDVERARKVRAGLASVIGGSAYWGSQVDAIILDALAAANAQGRAEIAERAALEMLARYGNGSMGQSLAAAIRALPDAADKGQVFDRLHSDPDIIRPEDVPKRVAPSADDVEWARVDGAAILAEAENYFVAAQRLAPYPHTPNVLTHERIAAALTAAHARGHELLPCGHVAANIGDTGSCEACNDMNAKYVQGLAEMREESAQIIRKRACGYLSLPSNAIFNAGLIIEDLSRLEQRIRALPDAALSAHPGRPFRPGRPAMTWNRWFAWYPVRAYGYAVGSVWRGHRWVWLSYVEWTEGHLIGDYLYRIQGDPR